MKPAKDTPKFEAALESLEKIVEEMESGDLPLDHLIKRYEEGMKLVKICRDKLADAEQKIEVLTKKASTPEPETPPADAESQTDDVSLF